MGPECAELFSHLAIRDSSQRLGGREGGSAGEQSNGLNVCLVVNAWLHSGGVGIIVHCKMPQAN